MAQMFQAAARQVIAANRMEHARAAAAAAARPVARVVAGELEVIINPEATLARRAVAVVGLVVGTALAARTAVLVVQFALVALVSAAMSQTQFYKGAPAPSPTELLKNILFLNWVLK